MRPRRTRRTWQRSPEDLAEIERLIARQTAAQKRHAEGQMLGFESLPDAARQAMHGMVVAYPALDAHTAIGNLKRAGLSYEQAQEMLPVALAQRDEDDVAAFSARMARRWGRPSAHAAAGASILRPQPVEQRRGRRSAR